MSGRNRTFVGLGVIAALLGLFVVLLLPDPAAEELPSKPARPSDSPRDKAPIAAPRPVANSPVDTPAPNETSRPPELRDETGQLLSEGPALAIELPERPEGALDTVPTPAESEAALDQVLTRLAAEITQAKAAGDTALVERLEVRRARLERKQAAQAEAAARD